MGEAELRAKQRAAAVEQMLGDVRPYDAYAESGCPKCGGPSTRQPRGLPVLGFTKIYCFGKQILNEDNKCPTLGEHLHAFCACGHGWLERCKDYVPESVLVS